MGESRGAYRVLVRNSEGKDHYEDLGADGILLKLILKISEGESMGWIGKV
jgi:hypothetical protein